MPTAIKRTSGVVVPKPLAWHGRMAAWALYALIRSVAATVRFRWDDRSGLFDSDYKDPVIFSIWHNRLPLCLDLYHRHVRGLQPHRRMAAVVSASRDGGFLAHLLELHQVQPVRGSTSRRGPQALLELTSWGEKGYDLAITPDGPRGPRYVVQSGAIALAQLTGFLIVPACYRLTFKKCLNNWDGSQIPLPGTRCDAVIGEPIRVPPEADEVEREALRLKLESAMMAITRD